MDESSQKKYQETKRTNFFLETLCQYIPLCGTLISIGYIIIYWNVKAWQLWGASGITLLGSVCFLFAGIFLRKGKALLALFVMVLASSVVMTTYALFWSGIKLGLILSAWIVPILLMIAGTKPGFHRYLSGLVGIINTALVLSVEKYQPINRLNITNQAVIRWIIPLLVIVGGFLILMLVIRATRIPRLFTRLLISFLIIVFIAIITISITSTYISLDSDRQYTIDSLETAVSLRENELVIWLTKIQDDLVDAYQGEDTQQAIQQLLESSSRRLEPYYSTSISKFNEHIAKTGSFDEIFIVNTRGIVLAATSSELEGMNLGTQNFFLNAKKALQIHPPTFFNPARETSLFITQPILDQNNTISGLLVGRTDMRSITMIVAARKGLGKTGGAYLVGGDFLLLSQWVSGESTDKINTDATAHAMQIKQDGFQEYVNHEGVDVIGFYRWIPQLNSVLIAEKEIEEAFQGSRATVRSNIVTAIIAFMIAIIGAYVLVRTITAPLGRLAAASRKLAQGDFQARADVDQVDEIGQVAFSFNNMAKELQGFVQSLETKVADRTRDVDRRALELQVAAEIAHDASQTNNLTDLLTRTARLIHDRFGFYHTGIFLLDDKKENAVLRAAGGEAGKLMLANHHKLRVGEVGIVGNVTFSGKPRIALDTSEDMNYYRNPLLPYTRSEMTLPISIRDKVIGALDIQSEKVDAFNDNDIAIMRIISDQLAISIEKIQMVQEVEQSAMRLETSFREYTSRTWRTFLDKSAGGLGYKYEGAEIQPITSLPAEYHKVLSTGQATYVTDVDTISGGTYVIPIMLRGQAIGMLSLKGLKRDIAPETQALIQDIVDRLALALENTRLIQEAMILARREQQINLVTGQMQQSVDLNMILQNTIRELGNVLGAPRTFIQIGLPQSTSQDFE